MTDDQKETQVQRSEREQSIDRVLAGIRRALVDDPRSRLYYIAGGIDCTMPGSPIRSARPSGRQVIVCVMGDTAPPDDLVGLMAALRPHIAPLAIP